MAQIAGQGSQCAGGCPFISHTLVFKDGNSTEDVAALTKQPPEKKYKIISIYRFFANMSTLFKCLVICSNNNKNKLKTKKLKQKSAFKVCDVENK